MGCKEEVWNKLDAVIGEEGIGVCSTSNLDVVNILLKVCPEMISMKYCLPGTNWSVVNV